MVPSLLTDGTITMKNKKITFLLFNSSFNYSCSFLLDGIGFAESSISRLLEDKARHPIHYRDAVRLVENEKK
jgi:hypothetical protein